MRRGNKVEMLKDVNNMWVEDGELLKNIAVEYFSGLFKADTRMGVGRFIIDAFPMLEDGVKKRVE